MDEVRKAKQLQSHLNTLITDTDVLKLEISNKQRELNQKLQIVQNLKKQIADINHTDNPKISEHAMLRYLERVKGIDIKACEKEILNESVLKMVKTLGGNGEYPGEGFVIKMKNFTVTTIV